jgi:uncharacterized membrane protein YkvA (DUF1232 family)
LAFRLVERSNAKSKRNRPKNRPKPVRAVVRSSVLTLQTLRLAASKTLEIPVPLSEDNSVRNTRRAENTQTANVPHSRSYYPLNLTNRKEFTDMANFSLESIYNWYRDLVRNPKYRWWIVGASLVYLLSPIDLLPEALLGPLGLVDDMVIITVLATELAGVLRDRVSAKKPKSDTKNTTATTEMVDIAAVEVK